MYYEHRHHFRHIAPVYRKLRTTDEEPIAYIAHRVKSLSAIKTAEFGCGDGRYTLPLLEHLGDRVSIQCIDYSAAMLTQLRRYLIKHGIQNYTTIKASAMRLPLKEASLNCAFTFNAVHHFDLPEFLLESARVLQEDGYLFVYTRLRSQNKRNIWAQFFPSFTSQETRLYELDELKTAIARASNLVLEHTRIFGFERQSSLERLVEQAQNRHYSTFDLYTSQDFNESLARFQSNLLGNFSDLHKIQWFDENILLIVRKHSRA